MEVVSPITPIHSNVYWIAQNGGNGTTNEEFLMWETYFVKRLAFVQPVSTINIQKLSYFGELVEDNWLSRQDFCGAVIKTTPVVRHREIICLNLWFEKTQRSKWSFSLE